MKISDSQPGDENPNMRWRLQRATRGNQEVFRVELNGIVSPEMRSQEAAELFVATGAMSELAQGIASVTQQASKAAAALNAKGDKELEEMGIKYFPRIIS